MLGSKKVIGVIPARLESTRLPRKVLREIAGRPMVQWVYEGARRSNLLDELLVATDHDLVREACAARAIPVLMTGRHASGTDRLWEVMENTTGEIYVNIQGDEPTIQPEHIELLLKPFANSAAQVSTLRVAISVADAQPPHNVKVVTDHENRALYFSRYPIPFDRDGSGNAPHYKHLGLYAYTRSALRLFHSLPQSSLEIAERLEQLRFLQNGIQIYAVEAGQDTLGVDTEEDLQRVTAVLTTRAAGFTDASPKA